MKYKEFEVLAENMPDDVADKVLEFLTWFFSLLGVKVSISVSSKTEEEILAELEEG